MTDPDSEPKTPESEKPKGSGRKKLLLIVLGAIVVAVGLVFGLPAWRYSLDHESTDDAFIEGHVMPVSARVPGHVAGVRVDHNQEVNAGDLLVVLDPADLEAALAAARSALVAAQARRRAAALAVELAEIGTRTDLEAAEAGVEMAKARVDAAGTGVEAAGSRLSQARVEVDVARAAVEESSAAVAARKASADRDRADLGRAEKMVESRSAPEQTLDHARAAAEQSSAQLLSEEKHLAAQRARVEQAKAAVAVATSALGQAKAERESAKAALAAATAKRDAARAGPKTVEAARAEEETAAAEIARAEAAVKAEELSLSYTKIVAPVAGRVTKKTVEDGQYVQPGQALLAIVPREVWVVANFKETQLARIRPDQPVQVRVDAWPDQAFAARVESIQRGTGARFSLLPPENATGNYVKVVQRVPVKIVFDPLPELDRFLLVPGMSVIPDVDISSR